MKNIVKFLFNSLIVALLTFFQPAFCLQQNENIISYINLNEKALYDVEIVLTKDDKILLPFKQLSEIFEVRVKTNHLTKEIEFETNEGKAGRVGFDYIIFNDKKISSNKNYYQKQGLMDEVRDEIYCTAEDLSVIFDSELKTDKNDLSVFANTKRDLILLREVDTQADSVDMSTYNYKGELFSFGGLGFNYKNKFKNFEYELGRVRGVKDENYTIANQMLGFQVSNYEFKPKSYRELSGQVANDSLVKVSTDSEEEITLSTYDGYYSLNDLNLAKEPKYIKLDEILADGSSKTIYEMKYPKYKNMPEEKSRRYTIFGGVTGYNNRLFNTNGYIYEMNTKKFLLGSQLEYGIKENLKFDSKISHDVICSQPKDSIWQSIYSADALLMSGTWKNPNNLEGTSWLNTLEYIKNDNFSARLLAGVSSANDLSLDLNKQYGYSLAGEAKYQKNNYYLKGGIFSTSADFYLAGSDGTYYNDRTGVMFSGGMAKGNWGVNASLKKYYSNTAYRFEGGLIDFNEYSFGFHKNMEKVADVRFNFNGRSGQNDIAKNHSYYYDLNISRKIGENLTLEGGKTESNYATKYSQGVQKYDDYSSKYSTIYLKADYKLPKNLGTLSLGHDVVSYDYSSQQNTYNMAKIGYTFPEIKRVTLSLGTGYKYTGSDNGFDIYANLAYRTKSGRVINLNYQYNQMGGYIINNMFLPMNSRHSINLVVNDAFALLPSGIKFVGFLDDNRGYVDVVAYIDKNKNGKYDRKDIRVKDVPIKFGWENNVVYTNLRGRAFATTSQAGVFNVKVDNEKLPATLLANKADEQGRMIRVESRKTTKVEIPLKSCIGNIKGKLKILDDFGRTMNLEDFIVVINNEAGEEISYSTVDEYGNFYFSGVPPGDFKIKLDDNFIYVNSLENYKGKSELNVKVPYGYKKFVDIEGLELVYKCI